RWNGVVWSPPEQLPPGANLLPVPVAAIANGTNNIDIFAAGIGNAPWWWHWDGFIWTPAQMLPPAGLPPERIAAVSPRPGRLDVFAAGAGNYLYHWWRESGLAWVKEDLGG